MIRNYRIRLHRPRTNSFIWVDIQTTYLKDAEDRAKREFPGWLITHSKVY